MVIGSVERSLMPDQSGFVKDMTVGREPVRYNLLDIVTIVRYKTRTVGNCDSGRGGDVTGFFNGPAFSMGRREVGEEMIGRGAHGRLQKRRSRGEHSWHDAVKQDRFLVLLAATANISRAAAGAKLRATGGYIYRQRNPLFRERWDMALAEGVTRVRALLTEAGEAQATMPKTADGEIDREALKHFHPPLAMALLKMHEPTVKGEALGRGRPVPRSADALRALIRERLAEARAMRGGADGGGEGSGGGGEGSGGGDGDDGNGPEAGGNGDA